MAERMPDTRLPFAAMNIVNQLFDLAEVPVKKRQEINDDADGFVLMMLRKVLGIDGERLSQQDVVEGHNIDHGPCSVCGVPHLYDGRIGDAEDA